MDTQIAALGKLQLAEGTVRAIESSNALRLLPGLRP